MAIIDTALGWSADEDWLKSSDGFIGDISVMGGADWPGQPIPHTQNTNSDVKTHGFLGAYYTDAPTDGFYFGDVSTDSSTAVYLFYIPNKIVFAVSATQRAKVRRAWYAGGGSQGGIVNTIDYQDPGSGLYYISMGQLGESNMAFNIPMFADLETGCAALATTTSSYKLRSGFSISCFIKAVGSGFPYVTPVQISSVPEYTILSTDGSSPASNSYASDFYYQGMRFTMSYLEPQHNASVSGNTVIYRDISNVGDMPLGIELFALIANMASLTVTEAGNPYTDPESSEAGGGGSDPIDDEVGLEPVVFPSAVNTGFCRIYCPSASELSNLSDYLWGPLFDLDTIKRLFADPMSSVLGLSVVPVSVSGTSSPVNIAGVSTGISLPKLTAQHIAVDLGSLQVTEKWGAYLDHEPYTKYSIYLPFIGYRTISADDVMGKWVHLSYDIDLLSGACVAKLVAGSTLLYQWAGNCAMQLPVNAANWNSVISSSIAAIGSMATAIASGGAAAPVVAGALSSAATLSTQMKPNIERAGGVNGAAAFLAGRRAYMIRTMPELVNPGNQQHYIGYPSFITKQLGSITGFNVVEDIHLEGIPATQAELEEIDTLLHEGVIL